MIDEGYTVSDQERRVPETVFVVRNGSDIDITETGRCLLVKLDTDNRHCEG